MNPERAARAVDELGAEAVAPEKVYDVECDVFAPCALGGALNDDTIPRLRCAVIAGAANNQLLDEQPARRELLLDRGILYAPDYVINAGGIINVELRAARRAATTQPSRCRRCTEIPSTLAGVFARARERGITTHAAAQEVAEAALAAGPSAAG